MLPQGTVIKTKLFPEKIFTFASTERGRWVPGIRDCTDAGKENQCDNNYNRSLTHCEFNERIVSALQHIHHFVADILFGQCFFRQE